VVDIVSVENKLQNKYQQYADTGKGSLGRVDLAEERDQSRVGKERERGGTYLLY
jgi:hypothetical protein